MSSSRMFDDLREIVAEFVAVHGVGNLSQRLRPLAHACAHRVPRGGEDVTSESFIAGYVQGYATGQKGQPGDA